MRFSPEAINKGVQTTREGEDVKERKNLAEGGDAKKKSLTLSVAATFLLILTAIPSEPYLFLRFYSFYVNECLYVCLCSMCMQYLKRPEEGAGPPGIIIIDVVSPHVSVTNT